MRIEMSSEEFKMMRNYLEGICGMRFHEEKSYFISSKLSNIILKYGYNDFKSFYNDVCLNKSKEINEKVIDAITIKETFWFRDEYTWTTFNEVLMPKYIDMIQREEKRKVWIWSAACATGQEPYSIAISILDFLEKNNLMYYADKFQIIATDISNKAIEIAKNGNYDFIAIKRGLSDECRIKYFEQKDKFWNINSRLKKMIKFKQLNLLNDFSSLGKFDIIFLRYIMVYFSPELRENIYEKTEGNLNIGGEMFIGNSEIFYGNKNLKLQEYKECIYYRRI
jgi:chemotaxis protein methyltransferase CheR